METAIYEFILGLVPAANSSARSPGGCCFLKAQVERQFLKVINKIRNQDEDLKVIPSKRRERLVVTSRVSKQSTWQRLGPSIYNHATGSTDDRSRINYL